MWVGTPCRGPSEWSGFWGKLTCYIGYRDTSCPEQGHFFFFWILACDWLFRSAIVWQSRTTPAIGSTQCVVPGPLQHKTIINDIVVIVIIYFQIIRFKMY